MAFSLCLFWPRAEDERVRLLIICKKGRREATDRQATILQTWRRMRHDNFIVHYAKALWLPTVSLNGLNRKQAMGEKENMSATRQRVSYTSLHHHQSVLKTTVL